MMADHKNILITGGSGRIGDLISFGNKPSHKQLDVCNPESIEKAFGIYKPSILLHLAALVDLDICQQYPGKAYEVNTIGTFNIAKICRKKGVKMVYMSTCTVFDGTKKDPYSENDIPNPIHIYGRTKRAGELITLDIVPDSLIIRTGWLFGNNNVDTGFVNICLNKLKNDDDLTVMTLDRFGSPVYIPDLLNTIKELINQNEKGIYHIVNSGKTSYLEIGKLIKKIGRFKTKIKKAIKRDTVPENPERGKMEALCSNKINLRPWQNALTEYLKDYLKLSS